MSVRKRKDGRWQIDIAMMIGGRKVRVKKSGGRTKVEALRAEHEERQRLLSGVGVRAGKAVTVADFAMEFLDGYVEANCKHATKIAYRSIARLHLVPELGELELEQVGSREVELYKARKLTAGAHPKSINGQLALLGRMLTVAKEWGKLGGQVPKMRLLKLPPRKFDFLDFDEARRLVDGADDAWRPFVLLALRTGLRIGELCALRWEDVDLVAGRLRVVRNVYAGVVGTPKSGREREIPLTNEARAALRELPSRFAGELVFPGEGGGHLKMTSVRRPLLRACRRAGLRPIMWHGLRHTFASHLTMRGVALKAVQELLGHATLEMTMRYAHLSPNVTRDAVALLDGPAAPVKVGAHG